HTNGRASTCSGNVEAKPFRKSNPGSPSSPGIGKKKKQALPPLFKNFSIAAAATSYPFWRGSSRPAITNQQSERPAPNFWRLPQTGRSADGTKSFSAERAFCLLSIFHSAIDLY